MRIRNIYKNNKNNKSKAYIHGNYDFAEISKNLARNRSENCVGPSK